MLSRLKITGFKNLVDADIFFGPFTCIAGINGVGKSNLFDAIRFLSALADRPMMQAASLIRNEDGRSSDIRNLFFRHGGHYDDTMNFEAEMIIPDSGTDDLGQKAKASITFLKYQLKLGYREDDNFSSLGALELLEENLTHINLGDIKKHLFFDYSKIWQKSALKGRRTSPFISTSRANGGFIALHQDGTNGRPLQRAASSLPRTVLSAANAAESKTALLARREMQSWKLLQLEPSALRKPDEFTAPVSLGMDGSHLPATLYHLAHNNHAQKIDHSAQTYAQVANKLSELINDVQDITIDRDEKRQLLTLNVVDKFGTSYPAHSLSDGTLRFLALSILALDPQAEGLLCLEEPENGIHPDRIPAILSLLNDISVDVNEEIGLANPLRQVIVNTHSPSVVSQVNADDLVVAELKEKIDTTGRKVKAISFSALEGSWRTKQNQMNVVARGTLLSYLNPTSYNKNDDFDNYLPLKNKDRKKRVVDERTHDLFEET